MSRPVDWSPLADSDPTPGDPEAVARGARHYATVAFAIRDASAKLRTIADNQAGMDSDAVNAFRDSTQRVADDIDKAYDRYAETSQALSRYYPQLDDAQYESLQALWQARQAQDMMQQASNAMAAAQARIEAAPPGTDTPEATGAYLRAYENRMQAHDALNQAQRRLERAVEAWDRAAQQAAAGINEIVEGADLNDGWYQNWGKKFLAQVAKWAGRIGAVAGVLSLFLGWVPILGQALFAITAVASAVSLVATSIRKAHGDASWLAVSIAAVGVFTAGIGKAASALRAARVAQTATTVSRASKSAAPIGRGTRAMTGFVRSADELGNYAGWGGKARAILKTGADEVVGGQAYRDFRYAQRIERQFARSADADELLRQTRQIKAAAVTSQTATYTGHGVTVYGAEEDIRKSVMASSPPPHRQLSLTQSRTLRDEQ